MGIANNHNTAKEMRRLVGSGFTDLNRLQLKLQY